MSKTAVSRPRVYVRVRPLNERETKEGKGKVICRGDPRQPDVLFFQKDEKAEEMQVRFDHIFDRNTSQEGVFEHISPEVLKTLFGGYNASIFAYGQTGSGKTHTMEGKKDSDTETGLIPRLIASIYQRFKENPEITDAQVLVSQVQVYQEKIQDLLNNRKQLDIHMDSEGQYVARDATWKPVTNVAECMKLYYEGTAKRATNATEMNLVSSRSHMILMLKMQWDEPALPGSHAQLNLIDLAGSERLDESGATGETMKEAIHINKSLSALANVVIKLVDAAKYPKKRVHIPYKDSKLTYLLQSSLGGANLAHFILAMSASGMWASETNSTIEFGKRALQLVIRPVRNAIDYTRLAEMEAMIEKMRSHIASLEEELQNRASNNTNFLQIEQIPQSAADEEAKRRGEASKTKKHLKRQTELTRIMENLPETFDDLTSHCVLFPESKVTFRELSGLEKLIYFVDKSVSTFYRANAAQTIASVIDDTGRDKFATLGGMDALTRLLQVKEERCKEAACVAIEALCRSHKKNKKALKPAVFEELVDLIYGYPNQQVQEAACATVATIVDGFPEATRRFEKLDVVPKLLETIRTTPEEVVNLTKAATNCIGRLAHGDPKMQQVIASFGGVDLLIDVLFSPGGDRDHQVPILASYALVNLCCSSKENLDIAKEHPRYKEVRYRLLEGLARAFGTNTAREGFGRATAQEDRAPFPYYGVTVKDKWTLSSSGGRPIFSTFMDNPQFILKVKEETHIAFIIQDTLYEARMRKKRRINAVYMGLAIFEGSPDVLGTGLKQLDFHGKMVEIGRYTSNCENVLHCCLPALDAPYIVVPFTSQKGRQTEFALSAFGDKPIELTAVPDQVGWMHTVLEGCWNEFTGRAGDNFDWRCNPQVKLAPSEDCRVVFVVSYLSLDKQRKRLRQEEEEEELNMRPRLHGRLFTNEFASEKRYLKALVPLPQGSTFVSTNSFASNSYITTAATLKKGEHYVFIPFTETPFQDTFRVSIYCDSDNMEINPLQDRDTTEWLCSTFSGIWAGKPVSMQLESKGRIVAIANSPSTFLRVRINNTKGKKVGGIDSYWNSEASAEYESNGAFTLNVEGMMRTEGKTQEVAKDRQFDVFIFSEKPCKTNKVDFTASPSSWAYPTTSTSPALLQYPVVVEDNEAGDPDDQLDDEDSIDEDDRVEELLDDLDRKEQANRELERKLAEQTEKLERLMAGGAPPAATKAGDAAATSQTEEPSPAAADGKKSKKKKNSTAGAGDAADGGKELKDAVEFALLKLNVLNERASSGTGTKEDWAAVQKDIAEIQERLLKGFEKPSK